MTIWIDMANSPHVTFMKPFIQRFERDGVPFFITARDYGNTIDLLEKEGWPFKEVGGHGGKGTLKKVLSFCNRIRLLRRELVDKRPTVAFSQSSFYSPIVAKTLGIPFLYTNDNEFAKGNIVARIPGGIAAYPEALRSSRKTGQFIGRNAIFYQGVKEAIYLSQSYRPRLANAEEKVIYYRPEPWLAQYHTANPEFSLKIIKVLQEFAAVKVVPRDRQQRDYYPSKVADMPRVEILQSVVSLDEIVSTASAFVGSGGTMCRESAILGLPTVSMYSGELLAVDKELMARGLLLHTHDLAELGEFVANASMQEGRSNLSEEVLSYGSRTFDSFCEKIYELMDR